MRVERFSDWDVLCSNKQNDVIDTIIYRVEIISVIRSIKAGFGGFKSFNCRILYSSRFILKPINL